LTRNFGAMIPRKTCHEASTNVIVRMRAKILGVKEAKAAVRGVLTLKLMLDNASGDYPFP